MRNTQELCLLTNTKIKYFQTQYFRVSKLHVLYSYIHIIVHFSVDFVLKDPREKDEDKEEKLPPHREELEVVPKPWMKSYIQARDLSSEILHVTNPCMLQVLDLWHATFR